MMRLGALEARVLVRSLARYHAGLGKAIRAGDHAADRARVQHAVEKVLDFLKGAGVPLPGDYAPSERGTGDDDPWAAEAARRLAERAEGGPE
jgi:hypothetical protein